jgi:hypothetical protein
MNQIFLLTSLLTFASLQSAGEPSDNKGGKEGVIPFKEITFFLQPYEQAGTQCKFTKLEASHDYMVYCSSYEFTVHFLARPYRQPTQEAVEILMMVSENTKNKITDSSTVSVWVKNSKGSDTQNILVSLGVFKETASLDVRVTL